MTIQRRNGNRVGILIAGDPVSAARQLRGGFDAMIQQAAASDDRVCWCSADARGEGLPDRSEAAGWVVTGSPASVTERLPWMVRAERWLRAAIDEGVPILGICFGHQLLAQALGGKVERNPRGREMGSMVAEVVSDDPLLPAAGSCFVVNATHQDSVTVPPRGSKVLARTDLEPHAALRFAPRAWGVQFHPEFDAELLRTYVRERSAVLSLEGRDPAALCESITDAPTGREVLARFVAQVICAAG